ncbi:MAG: hypothetical protein IJ735_03465 [Clostridia bacterium]|nr:hypothetical protein [Clostridia bacterium]
MKKSSLLSLLMCVVMIALFVGGCAASYVEETYDAKERAATLKTAFDGRDIINVHGVVTEGSDRVEISGTVNARDKSMRLSIDGDAYFYYAKYLFLQQESGYEVLSCTASYAAFLKNLPFSAFFFSYDEDDCESAYATSDHLVVTFGGAGVKRCFSSGRNASGGVYTVTYDKDEIKSTYLTTTVTEDGVEKSYSAYYTYSVGEEYSLEPTVLPGDGTPYAVYASAEIIKGASGKTLRTGVGADTRVETSSILPTLKSEYITPDDVENAFVIDHDDEYVTLNIVYKSAKTVIGLGAALREVAVTYKKADYDVTLIVINQGLRYTVA